LQFIDAYPDWIASYEHIDLARQKWFQSAFVHPSILADREALSLQEPLDGLYQSTRVVGVDQCAIGEEGRRGL